MKKLFLLALPFILFSCSSDDSGDAAPIVPIPESTNSYAYLRGDLDGVPFDYTFKLNDIFGQTSYTAITSISGGGSITSGSFSYGGMFTPIGNPDQFAYVSFDNMYYGDDTEESENFLNSMEVLPSNYITFAQDDALTKGVDLGYQESEGVNYSTMGGSQTGSTFVITDSSEGMDGPYPIKTVSGTFSCKLYNQDDNTDVINVTNGTFKIVMTDNH